MKEKDIDKNECWLAFRCQCCRNQVAEHILIGNDGSLRCPGCGGDLKQLTHDEIFGDSWGAKVINPYYRK